MAEIKVKKTQVDNPEEIMSVCPFDSIEYQDQLYINSGCKMCQICVKKYPEIFEFIKDEVIEIDKSLWKGIAVYVDHNMGDIHPVTYELIGKAREMAAKISQPVYAVFAGHNIKDKAEEILKYGVDEVFVYDYPELKNFRIEPYTAALDNFIEKRKPSVFLVGGSTTGRSLAPRVAARRRTGLTADCTILDIQENSDLDQIRPAFGGNVMAHIQTPNHRPQFATVRYKIFDKPEPIEYPTGKITIGSLEKEKLESKITILQSKKKEKVKGIEEAENIIVAGRGVKNENDMSLIYKLAEMLNAEVAATRPLIEAGWADANTQIGLSGRTVKPKLIITCGVSGAIQFVAGMKSSTTIIAIDEDENAPILSAAHYGVIGDLYEIIPSLCDIIAQKSEKGEMAYV
ncbi:MAG: electron transfer flavoprotein subunit alpha/FixB family protein [Thermodesulfobacteriota bacterium]